MIRMLVGMVLTVAAAAAGAQTGAQASVQASAAPPAPSVATSQATPIVECMRANIPPVVQIREIELAARDRAGGERLLRGRLYVTNEKLRFRAMLKIAAPPDLAGAAYLMREGETTDEIYVYVPALNKVRRVTGGNMDGPLWGTDLSYSDIRQIQNSFSDSNAKLEGRGELEKQPVHILSFTPRAGETSRYSLIRAWVDTKSCIALKTEFYEGSTVRKRVTGAARDLKQAGTHWFLTNLLVMDLKEGTQTQLRVNGVNVVKDLADRYFTPATFYVGN